MHNLFQAFANAADGVLIINQDQEIIYWNQAAREILGYRPQEVLNQPCYKILAGGDDQGGLVCQEFCRVAMTARQGGRVTNFDSSIRTKSGALRWINISTLTLPTNGVPADSIMVHLFRDVTKRKQNEQFIDQVLTAAKALRNGEFSQTVSPVQSDEQDIELTDRECEVLHLLAQGLSTNEIAQTLYITPATVRNHIRNILQKFQVHSRLEAVTYAFKYGLVKID
jgi:PAS domain S-box-containing protein